MCRATGHSGAPRRALLGFSVKSSTKVVVSAASGEEGGKEGSNDEVRTEGQRTKGGEEERPRQETVAARRWRVVSALLALFIISVKEGWSQCVLDFCRFSFSLAAGFIVIARKKTAKLILPSSYRRISLLRKSPRGRLASRDRSRIHVQFSGDLR